LLHRRKVWFIVSGSVIAIFLVLILYPATRLMDSGPYHKRDKAHRDLEGFSVLLQSFYIRYQRYPSDEEGLRAALAMTPGGEAVKDRRISDPWGRPYVYHSKPSGLPDVYSVGPNGIDEHGQGDDISASIQ
jgi:hypothetical protein